MCITSVLWNDGKTRVANISGHAWSYWLVWLRCHDSLLCLYHIWVWVLRQIRVLTIVTERSGSEYLNLLAHFFIIAIHHSSLSWSVPTPSNHRSYRADAVLRHGMYYLRPLLVALSWAFHWKPALRCWLYAGWRAYRFPPVDITALRYMSPQRTMAQICRGAHKASASCRSQGYRNHSRKRHCMTTKPEIPNIHETSWKVIQVIHNLSIQSSSPVC